MMRVPLSKPDIGTEELSAVAQILQSGWLAHGSANKEFERSLADYVGVERAISLNSCTSALFLALIANNIKGEVLLPSFTFVATANAIVTAGAIPVFVDVEYQTGNIDVRKLEASITPRTEALIVVHFAGQMCDMDVIMRIVDKHKLLLIEDSAETLGATYNKKQAGGFGIGCFSFYPTKNITTGEGGVLTTNDNALADRVAALAAHGVMKHTIDRQAGSKPWVRSARYAGFNFRMSNILAALGVVQLSKIDRMNEERQGHARFYDQALSGVSCLDLPSVKKHRTHVYQMYTVKVRDKDRDSIVQQLNTRGIGASVHFTPAVHEQEFYKGKFLAPAGLEVTERLSQTIMTLPLYPHMEPIEREAVAHTLQEVLND